MSKYTIHSPLKLADGFDDAAEIREQAGAAALTPAINAQTGTTYTLVLTDAGKVVTMTNANPNTLTIPLNSSVAFPVGTIINVIQLGAGVTTIAAVAGVDLNGEDEGEGDLFGPYQGVALQKLETNAWVVLGAIGTVE